MTRARLDAGLTQSDVAAALGANQTFVSEYELGERQLTVTQFIRVCFALALSPKSTIAESARAGVTGTRETRWMQTKVTTKCVLFSQQASFKVTQKGLVNQRLRDGTSYSEQNRAE